MTHFVTKAMSINRTAWLSFETYVAKLAQFVIQDQYHVNVDVVYSLRVHAHAHTHAHACAHTYCRNQVCSGYRLIQEM